jgi:hypothetical protein
VEFGAVFFYFLEEVEVKSEVILGQNTSDDMDFRDGLAIVFADNVQHFIEGKSPGIGIAALFDQAGVGAEFAVIDTQIGGFNVEIPVKIGVVAIFMFPDSIRQGTQERQRTRFVQEKSLFWRESLTVHCFLNDVAVIVA